ncbi:hypothetical protein N7532_003085 [Penicillium argentinense]|uniref:Uncharacterized protein n=1 Tax=Penicillium argentinense TaxID=1131581 RepID=A0A9W9KE62_9EURO|nr:uncharacterized protein N7532_003085 [Penicillium argentinense]KAJ5102556.1 hypothetical protein N7532_003085 [Penicillium argentinense]
MWIPVRLRRENSVNLALAYGDIAAYVQAIYSLKIACKEARSQVLSGMPNEHFRSAVVRDDGIPITPAKINTLIGIIERLRAHLGMPFWDIEAEAARFGNVNVGPDQEYIDDLLHVLINNSQYAEAIEFLDEWPCLDDFDLSRIGEIWCRECIERYAEWVSQEASML